MKKSSSKLSIAKAKQGSSSKLPLASPNHEDLVFTVWPLLEKHSSDDVVLKTCHNDYGWRALSKVDITGERKLRTNALRFAAEVNEAIVKQSQSKNK